MMVNVTLTGDVHDVLLSYQREGEQLPETLDRVFGAFVPMRSELERADIDPTKVDRETRVIHERWPDEDGFVDSRVYPHPTRYIETFEGVHPRVRSPDEVDLQRQIAEADVTAAEILDDLDGGDGE